MKRWIKILLVVIVAYLVVLALVQIAIYNHLASFNDVVHTKNPILDGQIEECINGWKNISVFFVINSIIIDNELYYKECKGTKTPDEFLRTKSGDCSEMTCLVAYIFNYFDAPNKICRESYILRGYNHVYNRVFINQSIINNSYTFDDGDYGWRYIEFHGIDSWHHSPCAGSYMTKEPQYRRDNYIPILETMLFCRYMEWDA